jgi:predicted SAM-dependent methyltransferase
MLQLVRAAPLPLKIIVGAGSVRRDGWVSLQSRELNIVDRAQWGRLFRPNSIDAILTEHTLEHLSVYEAAAAIRNFYDYLKSGGWVRCAVPDGFHTSENYLNWVAPGSDGERWLQQFRGGEPGHKTLWNYLTLSDLFLREGFDVMFREWFDEFGSFHKSDWSHKHGYIRRACGCPWSIVLSLVVGAPYTSLLVDAVKS